VSSQPGRHPGAGGQAGFTLLELIVVTAIMAILAAVAVPIYKDYVIKARVSEVMPALDLLKTMTQEYYAIRDELPVQLSDMGLDASVQGNYISGIAFYRTNAVNPDPVYAVVEVELDATALGIDPYTGYASRALVPKFGLVSSDVRYGDWLCFYRYIPPRYVPTNNCVCASAWPDNPSDTNWSCP